MKRIADRQIQREDGEDPHAVDSEASDSQPKQDAAPQQRAIRGLPKRRAPGIASPAVAQPIANPFASIGSTSTAKPGSESQKTPAANPFAKLTQNAPTSQQSISVSASVPAFTFNSKGLQSQPESSNVSDNTDAQPTDRSSVSEKTNSRLLTSEKSRNEVEIYKDIRGLNWSFIKALVNSFNQSSDCANFAPILSAFEQQYTQHYNTILQDRSRANLSTHSKADTKSPTVQTGENKRDIASLSSFGGSHPALFSGPLTSTALNAKAPSKDDIYPASDNLPKGTETPPQSHEKLDVINTFEDQHNDQKKKQSDSAANSTEFPQAGLFGKSSFTSSAAYGGASSILRDSTQSKQAGEDAAQKRLAALSSMRDRSGSKASTSPPTFSVSQRGFSFAGKSSSEILSSDQTVATSAPGAPTFSLTAEGFAFAGKSYTGNSNPSATAMPVPESNKSIEATPIPDNEHKADSTSSQADDTVKTLESTATPTIEPTRPITFGSASLSLSTESPSIIKSRSSAVSNHSPHRFSFGSKPTEDAAFTKAAFGPSFANTSGVTTGGQFSFGSAPISFGSKERSASPPNLASSPNHSE